MNKDFILIKDLYRNTENYIEKSVKVSGWVKTVRDSKTFGFIEINDGYIVDTPGFTTLEITFLEKDELKYSFPEFKEYNDLCKFRGCLHYKEPGCAVKEAVEDKKINKYRYDFYVKTLEEIMSRRKYK